MVLCSVNYCQESSGASQGVGVDQLQYIRCNTNGGPIWAGAPRLLVEGYVLRASNLVLSRCMMPIPVLTCPAGLSPFSVPPLELLFELLFQLPMSFVLAVLVSVHVMSRVAAEMVSAVQCFVTSGCRFTVLGF